MGIRSFKDLIVWQRSIDMIDEIYRVSRNFPKSEMYALSSQIQRAAVSVAANIAEGNGRNSTREYIHHLSYSLGSLAEVETYLVVSVRLGYVKQAAVSRIEATCDQIGKMLRSLQKALRSKLRRDDEQDPPRPSLQP
jgi:four helix bundle protein